MNRIDSRTVEFTDYIEVEVKERFEELLDNGHGIPEAATLALQEGLRNHPSNARFTRAFVEYLSEDTVFVTNRGAGRVMLTGKGRSLS